MNYIEKVIIKGFWGDKTVNIKLNEEENFLIGVNGSGKTTIINLIAASLTADFRVLDRIQFDKITIYLKNIQRKSVKSRIEIIKEENKNTPYQNVLFRIVKQGDKVPFQIYLDDFEEERMYRYPKEELYKRRNFRYHRKDLFYELNQLFKISWLSVQRLKIRVNHKDGRYHGSSIDQKLYELSESFVRYLSQLNKKSAEETDKFQKYFFLSLLSISNQDELTKTLVTLDTNEEKESLRNIYELFQVEERDYLNQMNEYFNSYIKTISGFVKGNNTTIEQIETLFGMKRIHSVVQEWKKLKEKQNEIFKNKNQFLSVINDLLRRKKIKINDKNEIIVETESGKIFPLNKLSSGEKQLLIIMGETLLQESKPHIFIADEPELSLHIEWQEKLVRSLKALNPNAQMIFATHSPDIVGIYQKSVIKIEKHIK